ncbi:MAG: homocysteine S-methyltransferase family protein [Anaerolineaceae bacterium]|nr:homocysteine S-methyltransferase family protein [Anaerolineaceae bacterium]
MNASEFLVFIEKKGTLILDGATGTNLQMRGLPIGTAPESWVLDQPHKIQALHADFLRAGSDILLTCTFGGTRLRLAHAGLDEKIHEVNSNAVKLVLQAAAGKEVLVGGSMGPTGEMMLPYGTLSEEDAYAAYHQQAEILLAAGVDLLVIETQFDLQEATLAVKAVRDLHANIALVCSFSYDRGMRTMMGVKPEQMAETFNPLEVTVLGINCGKSLHENLTVLKTLQANTDKPIWFKPNAGMPQTAPDGSLFYDVTPEQMGQYAKEWKAAGARLIGGCCGTSPQHLAEIAKIGKLM